MPLLFPKNIDVSKLRYGEVKKNAVGGKSVYVNYAGEPLDFQIPVMHIPYGISDASLLGGNKDSKDRRPSYSLNVSFKGMDDSKPLKNLYEKLQEIENKVKKDVFENRVTWLNDRYDDMEMIVNRLFSSNIQLDKDKETKKVLNRYPPTFRVKIPSKSTNDASTGEIMTEFLFNSYDMENTEINFDKIINNLKGGKAKLIIRFVGLWFAGGKYGCTWKIVSGQFKENTRTVSYQFMRDSDEEEEVKKDEDDDEEEFEDDIIHAVSDVNINGKSKTYVETSEEEEEEEVEEEEEEEEEEEPLPPPPPPKKTVKKTATKSRKLNV